ncbi:glutathione peroxidase [Olivibacter sp. XZL3]|uniref:glutathione peroxidase n=1 Tax=Olivibacter sp. XZL3 TaxID=1735116 RepID=UPI00106515E4|nr:glutathione peroxidase [Olivibacter sp. XZL3]
MKTLLLIMSLLITLPSENIYQFSFTSIDGKTINLKDFRGKKLLLVNTASKCGFTPQYKELEELSKRFAGKLVVIGFPANNFGSQEPGSNEDIKSFCEQNYGVTFLLAEKTSVKGDDINPIFAYLTSTANPNLAGEIKWNFEKFLIDENGQLVHRYRSAVKPLSPEITSQL